MEPKLFYDDEIDALRAQVQAMGGTKEVAARIWPDKTPMAAQRQLSDRLNPNRRSGINNATRARANMRSNESPSCRVRKFI